jgi:hypothetical protein
MAAAAEYREDARRLFLRSSNKYLGFLRQGGRLLRVLICDNMALRDT